MKFRNLKTSDKFDTPQSYLDDIYELNHYKFIVNKHNYINGRGETGMSVVKILYV